MHVKNLIGSLSLVFFLKVYKGPESVLRGVRRMAAQQLAAEPAVRQFVRDVLGKEAVISTCAWVPAAAAVDG